MRSRPKQPPCQEPLVLFYRAALDLSPATRTFVAELIVVHRDRIGSRRRVLRPGRQALLALVHLRCNETFARLAAAFGVGLATAHRYVTEVIALLAERAPDLREAMRTAQPKGNRSNPPSLPTFAAALWSACKGWWPRVDGGGGRSGAGWRWRLPWAHRASDYGIGAHGGHRRA
jgi:hypothetical protein